MKKRLTACLLALVMLCAAIPAMATKGPEDVDRQGNAIVSAERAASSSDSAEQGILIEKTSEMAASGELIEPKLLSQEEHEALVENAEPAAEFTMSQNYSAQQGEFDADVSYAEKRTTNFTTYGAQLPNLVYYAGNKKIDVGVALQKLYNNMKADIAKGTNSLVFRGETDAVKKLGVSFQLPGVSASYYEDIVRALGWRVYLCLDSDCPEMFYSNGYCSMGYSKSGSTITMYIIPGYRAGFTTLYQRTTLKKQLDTKVNELVAESQSYATAYEKMAFFHDWLCENNSYNNEAAQSSVGTYSANISGTPWSSASALLSSTNSSVKTPVCEGYSRAFQLLCQKVGITATVISSTSGNHMWNNVKYGTTWTGVDITWDDGSGSSYTHDYFCRAINGVSGHTMDDQYFVDWLYYPSLSSITSKAVLPYYDVPDNYWGRSMVQYVYDNEYMVGVTCAKFGPDIRVTRSQFVRILYNLAGQPEVEYSAQFLDVPDGKWYTDAVIWAYENQVTAGYDNGCFGVNDEITREQMTKMLCDYCGGVQPDEPEDDTPGDDNPVDKPSGNPEDTTGNTPTDTPGNTPDDTTTDTMGNTPSDTTTDTTGNTPTDTPADTPTDTPSDNPTDTPADTPTDTPADTPSDTPADTPSDTPTEPEPVSVLVAFKDAAKVSSWAYDAMCWAVENEIIHGYTDGTLKPEGRAARVEGAVLIYNIQQYIAAQDKETNTDTDTNEQTP